MTITEGHDDDDKIIIVIIIIIIIIIIMLCNKASRYGHVFSEARIIS